MTAVTPTPDTRWIPSAIGLLLSINQPRDVLRPCLWGDQEDERHSQDCQNALCRAHLLASVAQPIIENAILSIQTYPRFGVVQP